MYTVNGNRINDDDGNAFYDANHAVDTMFSDELSGLGQPDQSQKVCAMPVYQHVVDGMCIRGEFSPASEAFMAFKGVGATVEPEAEPERLNPAAVAAYAVLATVAALAVAAVVTED